MQSKKNTLLASIYKFLFFAVLYSVPFFCRAQFDTLNLDRLEPTYYYWDSCWHGYHVLNSDYTIILEDHYRKPTPVTLRYGMFKLGTVGKEDMNEVARYFHSDSTLRLFGVAAAVEYKKMNEPVIDSDFSHCLPEYFILYRTDSLDNMIPVDSIRADMATSKRYNMMLTFLPNYDIWSSYDHPALQVDIVDTTIEYFPITEAFFDQPIEMQGDFYISATSNNNYVVVYLRDSIWIPGQGGGWMYTYWASPAHPWTSVKGICMEDWSQPSSDNFSGPIPVKPYRKRSHRLAESWHDMGSGTNCAGIDVALYPIFDTGTYLFPEVSDDTCPLPSALRLFYRSDDTLTLVWNGPDNVQFEVGVSRADYPEVFDTFCLVSSQFVTLCGFDPGTWYIARVRTVCDSSRFSDWCDSIRFFIPSPPYVDGDDSIPTTTTVTVEEQYTLLMPNPATRDISVFSSFYISDISLFTLNGRKVLSRKVGASGTNLDVSSLPRGAYFVRIITSRGPVFKRLILR